MIIPFLGKLSVAQAITGSDENSENQIQVAAIDYANLTDVWWVVDTVVVAATAGTLKFALVLATSNTLGTSVEVCSVLIAAITDKRVATIGRHIVSLNVGKMLKDMLDTDGSTYPFIGQKNELAGTTTITIDSVLSTSEAATEYHRQVTGPGITGVPGLASP